MLRNREVGLGRFFDPHFSGIVRRIGILPIGRGNAEVKRPPHQQSPLYRTGTESHEPRRGTTPVYR